MVMVTGLPGTGKTTFAKELAEQLDAQHLNTDIIRDELGKRGQYDPETKAAVYDSMLRKADRLLSDNQKVVIDGTFYRAELRERFVKIARKHQIDLRWIELRADEEVIRQRVSKKREYSEADFNVYQKVKEAYQPLEQSHLVLWSDQLSLEEMVERAQDFLILRA